MKNILSGKTCIVYSVNSSLILYFEICQEIGPNALAQNHSKLFSECDMLGLRLEDVGTGFLRNMLEKVLDEICWTMLE